MGALAKVPARRMLAWANPRDRFSSMVHFHAEGSENRTLGGN